MKNNTSNIKLDKLWTVLLLLISILPSWILNIDKVVNVDEPRWIVRGANYYYALTHRDFENTIYEYHPGVTNMWVIGTATHFYFPEYRGSGEGYFDPLKPKFEEFMESNHKKTIELVRLSRFIHASVLAILATTAFLLLRILVGQKTAFLAIVLATISPFYLGHSRVLNLEGMLALFVLISFLGMYIYLYLYKDSNITHLLISGVAFGLAQLTKSSSIALIGLVGLMLLVGLFKKDEQTLQTKFLYAAKTFGVWFGSAALIYCILWPGMWVTPGKMLSEVYGNAFSYAFQGARLDVTEELAPESFNINNDDNGTFHFLRAWASSATPITLIGIVFAFFAIFSRDKDRFSNSIKSMLMYLLLLGGLFIVMFGVAQGRDSQHYILSSYVSFDIIAGIGWGFAWMLAQNKWQILNRTYASVTFIVALILTQIGFGLPYAPYYFTYKNPFAKQAATLGYGEGYNLAAEYLSAKPNAEDMRVYVYNGMGTFSYFFPGETLVFKRVYLIDESYEQIVEETKSSDYLVLYPVIREKQPETEKLFTAFENVTPEKTILINGIDYVYIYSVSEIPESVYETLVNQ